MAVIVRALDRSALAALAYALSLSWDVRAVHVDTGGDATHLVRERWRACRDGVGLEIVSDEAALERALSDAADLVIVPTVATRARLLYPFANWTSLRDARRLRRRGRAVTTLPFAA